MSDRDAEIVAAQRAACDAMISECLRWTHASTHAGMPYQNLRDLRDALYPAPPPPTRLKVIRDAVTEDGYLALMDGTLRFAFGVGEQPEDYARSDFEKGHGAPVTCHHLARLPMLVELARTQGREPCDE